MGKDCDIMEKATIEPRPEDSYVIALTIITRYLSMVCCEVIWQFMYIHVFNECVDTKCQKIN